LDDPCQCLDGLPGKGRIGGGVDHEQSLGGDSPSPFVHLLLQQFEIGGCSDFNGTLSVRQPVRKHLDRCIEQNEKIGAGLHRAHEMIESLTQRILGVTQDAIGVKAVREDKKIFVQPAIDKPNSRLASNLPLLFSAQEQIVELVGKRIASASSSLKIIGEQLLERALDVLLQPGHEGRCSGQLLDQRCLAYGSVADDGDQFAQRRFS
jgi:hypothetical protein